MADMVSIIAEVNGQTVLLTVAANATESEVPRWTDVVTTTDMGLPMSSSFQVQI